MNKKDKKQRAIERYKMFNYTFDPSFTLISQETIIFPATLCYVRTEQFLGFDEFAHHVAITNKRIALGSAMIFPDCYDETLGQFNLWHSNIDFKKSNIRGTFDIIGQNTNIKNIEYGTDAQIGDYIKVKPKWFLPTTITIYHPNAKKIYELFRK